MLTRSRVGGPREKGAAARLPMAFETIAPMIPEQNLDSADIAPLQRQAGAAMLLAWNLDDLFKHSSQQACTDMVSLNILLPVNQRAEIVQHIRARFPEILLAVLSDCKEQRAMMHVTIGGASTTPSLGNSHSGAPHRTFPIVDEPSSFFSASELLCEPETELDDALAGLTHRQQQVIRLLTRGYSNKLIARELGISPSTVKVHVHAAFRALGVHSRMAATAALRQARGDAFSSV